jgi:hypothetical protein
MSRETKMRATKRRKEMIKTWRIEIRRLPDGYTEDQDKFDGTEEQAVAEGYRWLREALYVDTYQKDVYVTEWGNSDHVAYCGTFDMVPGTN